MHRVHVVLIAEQWSVYVQVGLKMQFQGAQGQLMFFFGNKGEAIRWSASSAQCRPPASLPSSRGPFPAQLEPKKQIQVALTALLSRIWRAVRLTYRLAFNHSCQFSADGF